MASVAWVFPGQGTHEVGMGRDLCARSAAARAVFEVADRVLGFGLSRICFEGPEEELRRTQYAQPAILTTSIALIEAAREARNPAVMAHPAFAAGHSLGEYTAIVAAGALDFADGLRLVRERGRLMEEAGCASDSGMIAILGLSVDALVAVCREASADMSGEVVQVANVNAPDQAIISGTRRALVRAAELAKERGARRIHPLRVAGAFHSPVMAPAEPGLRRYLEGLRIRDCLIPLIANVTARPIQTAAELRNELGAQLTAPVRWQESVELMATAGVVRFLEIGPGCVLSLMIRRICPTVAVESL